MAKKAMLETASSRWLATAFASVLAVAACGPPCASESCVEVDLVGADQFAALHASWQIGALNAPTLPGLDITDLTLPRALSLDLPDAPIDATHRLSLILDERSDCELHDTESACTRGGAAVLWNGNPSVDGSAGLPLSARDSLSASVRKLQLHPFAFRPLTLPVPNNLHGDYVVGDFDHNGRDEVAVLYAQNELVLYRFDDGVGFHTYQTGNVFVGVAPRGIATADINHDGNLDLAVANAVSKSISLLYGKGDGLFNTATNYPLPVTETWTPEQITIGNLDGAGNLDIATTVRTEPAVKPASYYYAIFRGDALSTPTIFGLGASLAGPPFITDRLISFEVNGDSFDDLIFLSDRSDGVAMRFGNAGVPQNMGEYWDALGVGGPCKVVLSDVTSDGKTDLVLLHCDNDLHAAIWDGHRFLMSQPLSFVPNPVGAALAVADFNQDGRADIVVAGYGFVNPPNLNVMFYAGDGNGNFAPAVSFPLSAPATSLTVADIDGDGRPDLLIGHAPILPPMLDVSSVDVPQKPRYISVLRNYAR